MNKTASGFILVLGPIVAIVGASICQRAKSDSPLNDTYYDIMHAGGVGVVLLGLGMFFFGCLWFARKSK
jgi:hypothetical protein